ncbi:MAG: hypothetical protein ACRDRL_27120, partial [Sciscionella sp.]
SRMMRRRIDIYARSHYHASIVYQAMGLIPMTNRTSAGADPGTPAILRTDASRDAAVMIAREVLPETAWRKDHKRLTPGQLDGDARELLAIAQLDERPAAQS